MKLREMEVKGEGEKIGQKNPDVVKNRQKLPLLRKREFGKLFRQNAQKATPIGVTLVRT